MTYSVLTFNPLEYIEAFKKSISSYHRGVVLAREINKLEEKLPSSLFLDMPNIRFTIGGEYDRSSNSITIEEDILLVPDGNDTFIYSDRRPSNISKTTVLINTQSDHGISMLSEKLLKKGSSEYIVSWFYNSNKIDETNIGDLMDIPSFKYAASKRFMKKKEFFYGLTAMSVKNLSDSVVTFGMLEMNLNRLDDPQIKCVPSVIMGSTISASESSTVLSGESVSVTIGECSVRRTLGIKTVSVIDKKEGDTIFLMSTLKNAKNLFIEDSEPSRDTSVVSTEYLQRRSGNLFPIDRKNLPLETSVLGSDDHSICSNSSFIEMARVKAEETYSKLLKMKITGKDDSTLGELLSYLNQKIKDLKKNFILMDECSSITPNSIDEGCKVDCDTLSLRDDNLMVTKQKFKAVISCAMKCQ